RRLQAIRDIALPRNVIGSHLASCDESARAPLEDAFHVVRSYEHAAWCGSLGRVAMINGEAACRRAVLRYLESTNDFTERWLKNAVVRDESRGAECPVCSSAATVTRASLRIAGTDDRIVVRCARCGVVEDAPVGSRVTLEVDGAQALRVVGL